MRSDYIQMGFSIDTGEPELIIGRAENMPAVTSESVDVIVTSPPYNIGNTNWNNFKRNGRSLMGKVEYDAHDDDMAELDYQNWQIECLAEMARVLKPGGSLFYNHKNRLKDGKTISPFAWLLKASSFLTIRQEIIWDRGSTHQHDGSYFWPHDERVYWLVKGDRPALYHDSIGMANLWSFKANIHTWHPAPFPAELPRRCLQAIGGNDLMVLDPFAGSCTTLIVALDMRHRAIGVDVSQDYLFTAATRNGWLKQAEKLSL